MQPTSPPLPRESSFELLRILAQFFIVFYHLLLNVVFPDTGDPLYRALWLPLHIGVVLFVLISGYFGIRPGVKGLVRLVGTLAVYHLPLALCHRAIDGGGDLGHWLAVGCFVSATHFWFVRTYLCLYLLAPVINRFLHRIAPKERIALLAALAFVSHYVGSVGCDPSLAGGKNLATFLFLYAAGDTLRACRSSWLPYRRTCGLIWILLNAGLVVLFTCWTSPVGRAVFSRMWFSYCSFGLLASALLFFVWIGGLRFSSPLVNRVARSSLAIYLLHGAPLVALHVIAPFVVRYVCPLGGRGAVLGALLPLTLGIIAACVAIDNLLAPLWRALDRLGSRLGARWERLGCTYFSR